jgi:hypothetical protein
VDPIDDNPFQVQPFPTATLPLPDASSGVDAGSGGGCDVPAWLNERRLGLAFVAYKLDVSVDSDSCDQQYFVRLIDGLIGKATP